MTDIKTSLSQFEEPQQKSHLLTLRWGNSDIVIDDTVIQHSIFRATLQFDPECKHIEMRALEGASESTPEIAKHVFQLQTMLLAIIQSKPETKAQAEKQHMNTVHDLEELRELMMQNKDVGECLDVLTFQPGLLRISTDFARCLLLEPAYSVLNIWLARTLHGLHIRTIEQWLSLPPSLSSSSIINDPTVTTATALLPKSIAKEVARLDAESKMIKKLNKTKQEKTTKELNNAYAQLPVFVEPQL